MLKVTAQELRSVSASQTEFKSGVWGKFGGVPLGVKKIIQDYIDEAKKLIPPKYQNKIIVKSSEYVLTFSFEMGDGLFFEFGVDNGRLSVKMWGAEDDSGIEQGENSINTHLGRFKEVMETDMTILRSLAAQNGFEPKKVGIIEQARIDSIAFVENAVRKYGIEMDFEPSHGGDTIVFSFKEGTAGKPTAKEKAILQQAILGATKIFPGWTVPSDSHIDWTKDSVGMFLAPAFDFKMENGKMVY